MKFIRIILILILVFALSAGTAKVNATNATGNASGSVTVTLVSVLDSINITPTSSSLLPGGIRQFNANARDQFGSPMAGINISWISSNETVGTVWPLYQLTDIDGNASTNFTALSAGTAKVNATNATGNASGSVTVTLVPVLDSINITPTSSSLLPGGIRQFNAHARDQFGSPMPGINISWTSSNETVGTVWPLYQLTDIDGNASTNFTALSAGTAKVNATNATRNASGSVTVTQIPVISASITVNAVTGWYNYNWLYRKEIIINHIAVSANLTNFPLLIDILDSDLQLKAQTNGNDILFTDESGNKLSHEIEDYNSATGQLTAFVRIPYLSKLTDTRIYMYYGNDGASNGENPEDVWDSNYMAVYHLNEKTGNVNDSTSNHRNGTPNGSMNQDIPGKIDGGDSFDGINDRINLPQIFTTETQFTFETWLNTSNKQGYAISQRVSSNGSFIQYYPSTGNVQLYINSNYISKPISQNQWVHVVGTFNGTHGSLYVNGGTPSLFKTNLTWPESPVYIGDRWDSIRQFRGRLDEIRLSNVSRTLDYVKTTFNNQNNPGTFYNLGNETKNSASVLYSITVSPSTATLNPGGTMSFNATAKNQYNNPIAGVNISWKSTNLTVGNVTPSYAITDSSGNVSATFRAISIGTAIINATNRTVNDNAIITVRNNNHAPLISNENPVNGSTNISLNPYLSVYVEDTDGDPLNITFSYYNGSQWIILKSYTDRPSGTYTVETAGYMSEPNILYKWKVIVDDKLYQKEKIFYFTTGRILSLKWQVNYGAGNQAIPLMGDIDNDGVQEIVISGAGTVKAINGKTRAIKWTGSGSYSNVELIDLNGDRIPEVLTATNDRRLRAYNGNGTIRWTSPRLKGEVLPLFPIIGYDIDGDGYPTLYFATADYTPTTYDGNLSNYTGRLTMLDHNGKILAETWVYRPCWSGMSIGDVNFDGQFELYLGDRGGPPYYSVPANGLTAFNAHTLEMLWNRPDIVTSSPMPIIANVTGDKDLEVIAAFVTNKGVGVLNGMTGNTILDYLNQRLFAHGTGTVYDIDRDGNMEIMFAEGQKNTSAQQFLVFDLIKGTRDFQPNISVQIAWPPSAGDVTGDGYMEILAATGLQDRNGSYPIYIYNKEYKLIETVVVQNAGQLTPARIYDTDSDGYNELVVAGINGILSVYDTRAKTPDPAPRTWNQWYSEYRQGAAEYVPPPGPKEPVIRYENPANGSDNVSFNPVLSVKAFDFQKDDFNVTIEIFDGINWQVIASYFNQKVNKFTGFTASTSGYVNDYGKTYLWRVRVEDRNGNVGQKTFTFTTKQIKITNETPANGSTGIPKSLTQLRFNLTHSNLMNYSITTIPNIGSDSRANVRSGSYTLNVSSLSYDTAYIWKVIATDGVQWTNKTFTFTTEPAPAPWWNANWHNRKRIEINHNKISGDLTNFPFLVKLSDIDLATDAKNNGDDIVFITYAGTKLNHQIESYNSSTGDLVAWVNISAVSSTQDTILYMYYNNPLSSNQQNPEWVWDSSYTAVYHFNETGGSVSDSTSNRKNGVPQGGLNLSAPGKIDGAVDFDGVNDYIKLPKSNMTAGKSEVTLELWVNMDEFVLSNTIWDEYNNINYWQFSIRSDKWYTRDSSTGTTGFNRSNDLAMPAVTPGEWHQLTFVYSVSQSIKAIYMDGNLFASNSFSIDPLTNNRDNATIGYPSDGSYYDGKIDEVRVSYVARDANWITTSYTNQNNPGSTYTVREEEISS